MKVKRGICGCNETCQYSYTSGFNLEVCGDMKHVPGYITCQQNLCDIYMRNLFQQLTYWEPSIATTLRTDSTGFVSQHRQHILFY